MEAVEVTTRELALVTDCRDPVDNDMAEGGLVAVACTLIEDLIAQMEVKDDPPTNYSDEISSDFSRSNEKATSQSLVVWNRSTKSNDSMSASQNPILSPTTLQGTSSFESSESGRNVAGFFQEFLRETPLTLSNFPDGHPVSEYSNALEEQMNLPGRLGHATLVALSKWTLDTLGVHRSSIAVSVPTHVQTSLVDASPGLKTGPSHSNRPRRWRKKRDSPTHSTRRESSSVRLQMFGSEFARHLSSSALAPTLDGGRPPRHRRPRTMKHKTLSVVTENSIYLDDAEPAYQTGALLDLVITVGEYPPPAGFHRLGSSRRPFKLERGKQSLYLDVKKEPNWDKAAQRPCITSFTIVFPDRFEFVPPGFSIVRNRKCTHLDKSLDLPSKGNAGIPVNIGVSERAFLCYRRSREGNPITNIIPLSSSAAETIPLGFTVVEKSPRNFVASIQEKPGQSVFLAYQQRLANLEALRPLPLLISVLIGCSDRSMKDTEETIDAKLGAFYATSGTIVPSEVGRFHIMDRSTHSLLSPSSISNRLSLIEQSRISAGKKGLSITESTDLLTPLSRTPSVNSSLGDYWDRRYLQDGISETEDSRSDLVNLYEEESVENCISIFRETGPSIGRPYAVVFNENENRVCHAALSFIPELETATGSRLSMNQLQLRSLLITPILTSCYNRHGGSALVAVEGLHRLLTKTDFFADDVAESDDEFGGSCQRITLLDVAIQVVCDIATCGAQETTFAACVEFVEAAVRFSQAQLNIRTVGYVLRFYLFIFYFGASIPTSKSEWPDSTWGAPPSTTSDSVPTVASLLYDPRTDNESTYLPGGAPQTAALALKEMISLCLARLGNACVSNLICSAMNDASIIAYDGKNTGDIGSVVDGILSSAVDDAVSHVERANLAQLALHQIHRSGGSELFWHDMVNACGAGLFGRDTTLSDNSRSLYMMSFAVLTSLTKVAFGKSRAACSQERLPRDRASKILSLELLLHFLECWSDQQEAVCHISGPGHLPEKMQSIHTLAFVVRRMVAPCLLSNTRIALEDSAVFSRIIRIVFELWKSPVYRRHCKAELGVLIDHFVVRFLHLGPQLNASFHMDKYPGTAGQSHHLQQMLLLQELKRVFVVNPKQAVDLYINYEMEYENLENETIRLLPGSQWNLFQKVSSSLSSIAENCGEVIAHQIEEHRALIGTREGERSRAPTVDMTAIRESARNLRTASLEALTQMVRALALSAGASSNPQYAGLFTSWSSINTPVVQHDSIDGGTTDLTVLEDRLSFPVETDTDETMSGDSKRESIRVAIEIGRQKSLKKAVEYLVACNVLPPSPREVATFLRIHKDVFDPKALGMYLGENGVGGSEADYWDAIRLAFIRPISFVGMSVDQGLRHFLTHSGFVLPGEAQKIDRIINTFAQCYYEDNAGDVQVCPFRNEDAVYMLCFAVIMLNTDLHKISMSSRKGHKMTKTEFIQNMRSVEQGAEIPRQYLSDIYDSIESNPIALDESSSESSTSEDKNAAVQDILNNVRIGTSLLHSLAVHDFKFLSSEDVAASRNQTLQIALAQTTREIVSKNWHHWHSVISTCLETAHLDLQGMESCVDILLYALGITVCLDMEIETAAFLAQLGRLKSFEELRQGGWIQKPDEEAFLGEDWFVELEEACSGSVERRIWGLRNIREWMESVQAALLEDVCSQAELTRAIAQIENGESLLQDPARSFVRSGDLLKKSGRTGRTVEYRFFLFSDMFVYAKPEESGKYKIHEELPLHQMKVVDWYPSTQKLRQRAFDIHHPRKKFTVLCPNSEDRKRWVEDIRKAIMNEVERKMRLEAARLAVITKEL